MMRHTLPAALALGTAALALGGCETSPGTQVTRFHHGEPIARGRITVEPARPADRGSLEYQAYASIVGAELARLGFGEAPGLAAPEQVATIAVERDSRETPRRSSFSIGLGGGSYGRGGGIGGGVSLPIGGRRSDETVVTHLLVQIRRGSDTAVLWEGRAETAARAGTPEADPAAAVRRLAAALFQGFPGPNGQTIMVK